MDLFYFEFGLRQLGFWENGFWACDQIAQQWGKVCNFQKLMGLNGLD